jgi:hypothetical protein
MLIPGLHREGRRVVPYIVPEGSTLRITGVASYLAINAWVAEQSALCADLPKGYRRDGGRLHPRFGGRGFDGLPGGACSGRSRMHDCRECDRCGSHDRRRRQSDRRGRRDPAGGYLVGVPRRSGELSSIVPSWPTARWSNRAKSSATRYGCRRRPARERRRREGRTATGLSDRARVHRRTATGRGRPWPTWSQTHIRSPGESLCISYLPLLIPDCRSRGPGAARSWRCRWPRGPCWTIWSAAWPDWDPKTSS